MSGHFKNHTGKGQRFLPRRQPWSSRQDNAPLGQARLRLVATENASTHASQPGLLGVMIRLVLPFLSR